MKEGRKVRVDPAATDRRVDELIWEQVCRTPDAVAAVCDQEALTYRELWARCSAAAAELARRGIGREALVGLHLERSLDMLVAVLAVMRAGAAYVPLDPDFPPDRLRHMVQDSGLALIVTHSRLAGRTPLNGTAMLELDSVSPPSPAAKLPAPAGLLPGRGCDLLYVLYTSGSTGRPKGVALEHRNVVNFLLSMQQEPGLAPDDVLLAVTTLSFDIAGLELLLPLVTGARVVIATREQAGDGERLLALIEQHQVTVMQATPSLWRILIEAGWPGSPGFKALCGGEALPVDLAGALTSRCAEVWNMYGPTETAIWSSSYRVPESGPLLIGRPIANTRIYVLDKAHRPVPAGIPGEIYIAGAGVARGYLNLPELNEERFRPDPYGASGERMYRTGDLGRYLGNGNLEFRGRADSQVKVRGFRIEIGEIETILSSHPGVRAAVVKLEEVKAGDARLVAFVMPANADPALAGALREHLRASLPQYMIPQHFRSVARFPLLPNGKIDRNGLSGIESFNLSPDEGADAGQPADELAPATQAEKQIGAIWSRLLGVERISIKDNFLDLGGHSLLVATAVAEIRKLTGVRLQPARFAFETLEQLADSLAAEPAATEESVGVVGRLLRRFGST